MWVMTLIATICRLCGAECKPGRGAIVAGTMAIGA
jgi:hypothetical protein